MSRVADGIVWAQARVGNRIVVGGSFTQVELPDGTLVDQPYLFAYDIESLAFDFGFDPVVEDAVLALEADPDGSGIYVGGQFKQIDGAWRLRFAKLTNDGEVDLGFSADVDARVMAIAADTQRVYIGGAFSWAGGQPRSGLCRSRRRDR